MPKTHWRLFAVCTGAQCAQSKIDASSCPRHTQQQISSGYLRRRIDHVEYLSQIKFLRRKKVVDISWTISCTFKESSTKNLLILIKVILDFMRFPFSALPKALYARSNQELRQMCWQVDQKSSCGLLSLALDSCYLHEQSCTTAAAWKVNLLSGQREFESSQLQLSLIFGS